jgi:hypothetical protein
MEAVALSKILPVDSGGSSDCHRAFQQFLTGLTTRVKTMKPGNVMITPCGWLDAPPLPPRPSGKEVGRKAEEAQALFDQKVRDMGPASSHLLLLVLRRHDNDLFSVSVCNVAQGERFSGGGGGGRPRSVVRAGGARGAKNANKSLSGREYVGSHNVSRD